MLSIRSGLLIVLPSVSVHVGVDIHIPVVWLVLLSATVGIADTVGPQVGIIIVVVDVFDETLPYDISTLEGAFEVIAWTWVFMEARVEIDVVVVVWVVDAGTQVLIFVSWLATLLLAAAVDGPLFLPLLLCWPDMTVKFFF